MTGTDIRTISLYSDMRTYSKVHRALSVFTEYVLQKGGAGIVVMKRLAVAEKNVRTAPYSSDFFFLLLDYSSQNTTTNQAK